MDRDCACTPCPDPAVGTRPYNGRMPRRFPLAVLVLASVAALAALAQPAPGPLVQESQALEARKNQKVERIHNEDSSTVIDEVRYGGETKSIVVRPKGGLPEYEITPSDMARTRPGDNRDGLSSANGKRVWNVLKF